MTTLERIRVHPIKSLDAASVETAAIVDNGGLEWDRRYAMVDADGAYVNGKRERRVHRIRAEYDLERETVSLRTAADDGRTFRFHLEDDREDLEAWLSERAGREIELRRDDRGGMPDDTDASGPTVIASGTLEEVASWYPDIDAAEMGRRLRPNLIVDAPAFWEDRLYDEPGFAVPFAIGDVAFRGDSPCQRCVVPTRDPDTGEETPGFRETFVARRRESLPEWAAESQFDHFFRLMVNTRVPRESWGERLSVGDPVSIDAPVPSAERD